MVTKRGDIMVSIEAVEKLSKKYSMSSDEFIKLGSTLAMKEKKRNLHIEKLEILTRYETETVKELENKIKKEQYQNIRHGST